jgi:hypothetical protein
VEDAGEILNNCVAKSSQRCHSLTAVARVLGGDVGVVCALFGGGASAGCGGKHDRPIVGNFPDFPDATENLLKASGF